MIKENVVSCNTIKVANRSFLRPFAIELIEVDFIGQGDCSILFECLAENFDHAVEQALSVYSNAAILEVASQ